MWKLSAAVPAVAILSVAMWAASPVDQLPPGPMQERATAVCGSCHAVRIVVQQRLSKAAWAKEVDKMTKWGAEVDPKRREALIDYLSANFSPDKPAYVPPVSAKQPEVEKQ